MKVEKPIISEGRVTSEQMQTNINNPTSIFDGTFADKNGNGIIDAYDFNNDEAVVKQLEDAGLLGQSWNNSEEKVKNLLNTSTQSLTDVWVVQNNQSVSQIAVMILKQTKPDYTQADIDNMSKQLLEMNKNKLDGTKKGFLVNAKIKLPVMIDISKEKQSENPVHDYVWGTQSKRVNDIVAKYNLINTGNTHSKTYNDALLLSNEFIKRYGFLDSTSREHLILSPHFEASENTREKLNAVREDTWYGSATDRISRIEKNVKKYKAANCGECSELLAKMGFEKFNDKYEISELYFSVYNSDDTADRDREHIAMLMKSKDGKEEYIVDPWICPKNGGIFKRKDWEKMMKEIYQVKNGERCEFREEFDNINELNRDKPFYDKVSELSKEIPKENLNTVDSFTRYVGMELRKGKTFSKNVMEMFKQYSSYSYDEIFVRYKDFYAKRELIKKEVSEEASMDIYNFENEVFENLIKNKKYSKDIMNLFKRFCQNKYNDYLQSLELKKHTAEIQKAFPDENIETLTNYSWEFSMAIYNGIKDGKKYSPELIDLHCRLGRFVTNETKISNAKYRISKTDKAYLNFEKQFYKTMTPQVLTQYLNNITDYRAALVTLEKHYTKLITDIDKTKSGWGKGEEKKALIKPFVDFVAKACKSLGVGSEDIENFQTICEQELNATFYTDEKEIISAFREILANINSEYKENKFFENY